MKLKMEQLIKNIVIEIPAGKFTGFLWKSDQKPYEVKVLNDEMTEPITLDASENPFVVEGQLYDDKSKKSYSIKYIDGLYWLIQYDVEKLDKEIMCKDRKEHKYIASFDNAPGRLCFREYWREQDDEDKQCLGFKTLCPAEFVFVGFDK